MSENKLHPKARKLLSELREIGGEVRASKLEDRGFSHPEIARAVMWLEEEDLITTEEEKETYLALTRQGRDAYIKDLPEKRLLEALELEDEIPIRELREELENVDVGIGIAKKNEWVSITSEDDENVLKLTERGKKALEKGFELENALEKIQKNRKIEDEEIIEELKSRGLLEEKISKEIVIKVRKSSKGEFDEEYEGKESVSQLNPDMIKSRDWRDLDIREYDVESPVKIIRPGKKHPYRNYLDTVREKLLKLGFSEVKTSLVEMEFWNFDALFQAQDHPAREIHDKFELEDPKYGDLEQNEIVKNVKRTHENGWVLDSAGWGYEWNKKQASKLMLRSQNTASSIRTLAEGLETPAKVFTIDRVFRPDVIDSTHFIEFYQMEGIVKADGLSLRNLLGYLKLFAEEIAGADEIRFRPGYFPFTEPSVEIDAYHEKIGWLELGGAGLFRPEVLRPLGIEDNVIAWGLGIDRLAMFKLGIEDIRDLVFPTDIDYMRKAPLKGLE